MPSFICVKIILFLGIYFFVQNVLLVLKLFHFFINLHFRILIQVHFQHLGIVYLLLLK